MKTNTLAGKLASKAHASFISDSTRQSGEIFSDVKFIRLSHWRECQRSTSLGGGLACAGQIYRRFELKQNSKVFLEFWYRGFPLKEQLGESFVRLLKEQGQIELWSLVNVAEVLGWVGERLLNEFKREPEEAAEPLIIIDDAEIGEINQRRVLAVWWRDLQAERKYLSLFLDVEGNGITVHEVHFSAPEAEIQKHSEIIVETLRSFQWNRECPPPVGSCKRSA